MLTRSTIAWTAAAILFMAIGARIEAIASAHHAPTLDAMRAAEVTARAGVGLSMVGMLIFIAVLTAHIPQDRRAP